MFCCLNFVVWGWRTRWEKEEGAEGENKRETNRWEAQGGAGACTNHRGGDHHHHHHHWERHHTRYCAASPWTAWEEGHVGEDQGQATWPPHLPLNLPPYVQMASLLGFYIVYAVGCLLLLLEFEFMGMLCVSFMYLHIVRVWRLCNIPSGWCVSMYWFH